VSQLYEMATIRPRGSVLDECIGDLMLVQGVVKTGTADVESGWLDSEWRNTENSRRAKFYILTRTGRKQLEIEEADWNRRASAVARLLRQEA